MQFWTVSLKKVVKRCVFKRGTLWRFEPTWTGSVRFSSEQFYNPGNDWTGLKVQFFSGSVQSSCQFFPVQWTGLLNTNKSFKLSKRWDKLPRKPQICCRDKPGPTPLFVLGHHSIKWWWQAAKKKNRQEAYSTLHKNIKQLTGCPVGSGTMQKLKTNPCQAFIMHRHANHDST